MLNKIRKAGDSLAVRIIFGAIAAAFVLWGVEDVLKYGSKANYVTFNKAKSISETEFLKARSEEINNIQRKTGTNLSEVEIEAIGINQSVTRRIITNHLLDYLSDSYKLNPSENFLISYIKKLPEFKNEKDEFDAALFKSRFENSYLSQEEYFAIQKRYITRQTLINIFAEGFFVPRPMSDNLIDYLSETREIYLLSIDLKSGGQDTITAPLAPEEIEAFYEANKDLFTVPEKRGAIYALITPNTLQGRITVTDQEIEDYYNENKEEYKNKSLKTVTKAIKEALSAKKATELLPELIENLEDSVASGMNLEEVAKKYNLKIEKMADISYSDLLSNKNPLAEASDAIFDLTEKELSYPIELQSKDLLLVEILSIEPQKLQPFSSVENQARKLLQEQNIANLNLKIISNLSKDLSTGDYNKLPKAIQINKSIILSRDTNKEHKIPAEIVFNVFQTKNHSATPVTQVDGKAYFAVIKNIKVDKNHRNKIEKESLDSINAVIQNSIMEELISYLIKDNRMKIHELPKNL